MFLVILHISFSGLYRPKTRRFLMNREHAPNAYILKWPFTVTKDYLVLASCRKITLQTMEKFDVTTNTGTFSRRPQSFFTIPLAGELFNSPCWKRLPIPGMRPFLHGEMKKGLHPGTKRLFQHGDICKRSPSRDQKAFLHERGNNKQHQEHHVATSWCKNASSNRPQQQ